MNPYQRGVFGAGKWQKGQIKANVGLRSGKLICKSGLHMAFDPFSIFSFALTLRWVVSLLRNWIFSLFWSVFPCWWLSFFLSFPSQKAWQTKAISAIEASTRGKASKWCCWEKILYLSRPSKWFGSQILGLQQFDLPSAGSEPQGNQSFLCVMARQDTELRAKCSIWSRCSEIRCCLLRCLVWVTLSFAM